jgi:nicotine blue oxidoreductase
VGFNTIWILVLAAGQASRFGSPKQLARLQDKSLLGCMASKVEKLRCRLALDGVRARSLLVLGAHADLIQQQEDMNLWDIVVEASSWEQGMAASLNEGLNASMSADQVEGRLSAGALVLLLDQPLIEVSELASMVKSSLERGQIVCSKYADSVGVPVFFPASELSALRRVKGQAGGAKAFIQQRPYSVMSMKGVEHDIDTPSDLFAIEQARSALD